MTDERANNSAHTRRVVRIPEGYEGDFIQLRNLDDPTVQQIASALNEQPPMLNFYNLNKKVAAKVTHATYEEVSSIVNNLLPLYMLRARTELSVEELADDVLRALAETGVEELKFTDSDHDWFKNRLQQMLEAESIYLGLKASDLMVEHEQTFHGAQVFTDLRPVFGHDIESGPSASVIVHTLKISYHSDGKEETEDFYLTMDSRETTTLAEALDRADAKASSLRSFIEGTSVRYVDPEGE